MAHHQIHVFQATLLCAMHNQCHIGSLRAKMAKFLKQIYVEIGILCDLAPPPTVSERDTAVANTAVCNSLSDKTTDSTCYVITVLCVERLYVEVNTYVTP